MEFIDILNLIIGALCVYWAITGKGYPYKVDYPKKIKKYSDKLMRITLSLEGPACLGMAAISYFAKGEDKALISPWNIVFYVLLGLAVVFIALYIILLYSKYGKEILASNNKNKKPKYYK